MISYTYCFFVSVYKKKNWREKKKSHTNLRNLIWVIQNLAEPVCQTNFWDDFTQWSVCCTYCKMACCSPACGGCKVCTVLQAGGQGCTESVHMQPWHVSPLILEKEEILRKRFSVSSSSLYLVHLLLSRFEVTVRKLHAQLSETETRTLL